MKYQLSFHNTQIKSITFTYISSIAYGKDKLIEKYMCLLYSPKNPTLLLLLQLTLGGVTIDPCMGSNVTHKIEMKNVIFQKNYLSKLLKTIIKRLR